MLEIQGLHTSYRGIRALRGVSLHVAAGEMVALIGANGAGKSTLLNSISGVVRSERGAIRFDGRDIAGDSPWNTAREGLLQVPEGRQVIADLSVLENLEVGRTALGRRPARYTLGDIHALFPVLKERESQLAGSLSGGQQQMLAIGRALMGSPRMLLLDEPSLGLAPLVINQVFAALRKINEAGLTVLLVEQNARKALALTARAYVLDQGEIVHQGASAALAADPAISAHYLGGAG